MVASRFSENSVILGNVQKGENRPIFVKIDQIMLPYLLSNPIVKDSKTQKGLKTKFENRVNVI